jgi:hypothetical protein
VEISPRVCRDFNKCDAMSQRSRIFTLQAIANLIAKQVAAERTRCRALCEQRAELWRNTEGGKSPLAQEARFRANEAIYIADLLH